MGEVIRIREDIEVPEDAELNIEVQEGDGEDKEGEVEVTPGEDTIVELDEAGKSQDVPREKYYDAKLADIRKKVAETSTTKHSPEQTLQAIRNNITETERDLNKTAKGLKRFFKGKRRSMLEAQLERLRRMQEEAEKKGNHS